MLSGSDSGHKLLVISRTAQSRTKGAILNDARNRSEFHVFLMKSSVLRELAVYVVVA